MADSIARYLAKFCGPRGYIEQEKDPILSDFLVDLYEQGVKMAAIKLVGPDANQLQTGEEMDAVRDRIRDFIKIE